MSECKSRDTFCVVCGRYVMYVNRRSLNDRTKASYEKCFNISRQTLDNNWTPKIACSNCQAHLFHNDKGIKNAKHFSTPMLWRKPKNHKTDCYFCSCNTSGYNSKNIDTIVYPKVSSVTFSVPILENEESNDKIDEQASHSQDCVSNSQGSASSSEESPRISQETDEEEYEVQNSTEEGKFNQDELSDLIRDLGLSKENGELLASRLKEKKCLAKGTKVSFYRDRDLPFRKYFSEENNLVYCNDVEGLVNEFESISYKAEEWRLFMDSTTKNFKAILLNNGNKYAPIPVAHSTVLNEKYEDLKFVLEKLNYNEHQWLLCGDLKIITILLGQQSGFTKYPCFLCEWDSRAREQHYVKYDWPARNILEIGSKNNLKKNLLPVEKILLPPLHIKLGLIKQLVKAMKAKNSVAFAYLSEKFPKLSDAKINEGVFNGPQIRALFNDEHFEELMTDTEKEAWQSFKEISTSFLGNKKTLEYKNLAKRLVTAYQKMNCLMNLKLHFLDSHIDYFPDNLGDLSEEHGERMHQDLKDVEKRWQGVCEVNMLADYCWGLKRDTKLHHKRKSIRRSFESKKTRYSSKRS